MKAKNPQMYQIVSQARQNKNNPMEMFKNITKDYTPEQMSSFYNQAERMGVPPELIEQVKNDSQVSTQ